MNFIFKSFDTLNVYELYAILQLREEVFQLEQTCLYNDIDGKDLHCKHLLLYVDTTLVAYCRIVPAGISYDNYVSIGRVLSSAKYRKMNYGKILMQQALHEIQQVYPQYSIKISAQAYLQNFYETFGFLKIGDVYLEDDIPHIAMVKQVVL